MPYVVVGAFDDNACTVIDVTVPAAPAFSGVLEGAGAPNFLDTPTGVAVSGNYAFVASTGDLVIPVINISNPLAPAIVGVIDSFGHASAVAPFNVYISGNYLFINGGPSNRVAIWDISNPLAPVFVSSVVDAGGVLPYLIGNTYSRIYGNLWYVSGNAGATGLFTLFNITNPAIPVAIGGYVQPMLRPYGFDVFGNYVIMGINVGMVVINFTNPMIPVFSAPVLGASGVDIKVDGHHAYKLCDASLQVFDLSFLPAPPVLVGEIPAPGFNGGMKISIEGIYAYISERTSNRFTIVDINDPTNPTIVGSINGAGAPNWLGGATGNAYFAGGPPPVVLPTVQTLPATGVS